MAAEMLLFSFAYLENTLTLCIVMNNARKYALSNEALCYFFPASDANIAKFLQFRTDTSVRVFSDNVHRNLLIRVRAPTLQQDKEKIRLC